jgi:hypothetical protein
MPNAFNKINGFVEHKNNGVHNFAAHQLTVLLSNVAPGTDGVNASTAAAVRATVTEVDYTNCSSRNVTTVSSTQTGGVYSLVLQDLTLTASGGSVGPFQYVYLCNDTPTSPADPLIGYYDYGAPITLLDTESIDINFDTTALTDS